MSYRSLTEFDVEVARGKVAGWSKVNKFGYALDCDSGVPTDIWDGADGATSTDVWVPPTDARVHNIVSASALDAAAGTGMRTLQISGLTSWDTAEVSEVVVLNGVVNVATVNSYVIIHRMVGITFGLSEANAGIITATAVIDATITAAIQVGEGQTLMAIYGVPSTQTIFIRILKASVVRTGASVVLIGRLLVRLNADASDAGWVTKERKRFTETLPWDPNINDPVKSFVGPCIVKLQVEATVNGTEVAGGFDAFVVDN